MAFRAGHCWEICIIIFILAIASHPVHADTSIGRLSVPEIEDALQQCPLVQDLNAYKKATAPEVTGYASQFFDTLFPGISFGGIPAPAVNALLATLYISGPPNFLLALCPPNIDPSSLSVMVAFAVGGLLGDTLFHLLPEIFLGEAEPDRARFVLVEPKKNLLLGVAIMVGFVTFVAMDKGLRIATGGEDVHEHGHTKGAKAEKADDFPPAAVATGATPVQANGHLRPRKGEEVILEDPEKFRIPLTALRRLWQYKEPERSTRWLADALQPDPETKVMQIAIWKAYEAAFAGSDVPLSFAKDFIQSISSVIKGAKAQVTTGNKPKFVIKGVKPRDWSDRENEISQEPATKSKKEDKGASPSIRLSAYLNLIADFTHNITDGLAMSSSFYASPTLGATTAVAVFFHEIPHEVGDFALLIQSGFSKRKAMGAQFMTALGAFLGTCIGIAVQEFGKSGSVGFDGETYSKGLAGTGLGWGDLLLPFTAGTFLYVGTVAVIPELLDTGPNKRQELKQTAAQFVALAAGAGIMLAISWS